MSQHVLPPWRPMGELRSLPRDTWVVGLRAGWAAENSAEPPAVVGQVYDLDPYAIIDRSVGRWYVCSGWLPLGPLE